jgi:two-component system, response regulator YesN
MLRLLIVDDEVHAVEGIRSGVHWEKLGIAEVYSALTVKQAKELFDSKQIDILLCDIEMPEASGLELVEWVKQQHPRTETIFLTCHADFKYAQQALQLGSIDYILKPIPYDELEKVIQKAIEKVITDTEQAEYRQYGQFWVKQQPVLIERFWLDIVNQTIPSNLESIGRAAAERNIPFVEEMSFIPILISIQSWHKQMTLRDEKIMEYALQNTAEELIIGAKRDGQVIVIEGGKLLVILSAEGGADRSSSLMEACEQYITSCRQYFFCDLSCYIGERALGNEMYSMVSRLREMEKENVAYSNKVFQLSLHSTVYSLSVKLPDMGVWAVFMIEGGERKVLEEAIAFLQLHRQRDELHITLLRQFFQDFQQMIYYVLQTKGIQAHQLFSDRVSLDYSENAIRTLSALIDWMKHVVNKAMEYVSTVEQSQSIVERVIRYIKQHIAEDLSREDIAGHVFLNPDYLSRMFKKEMGMAVSDYVFQERLKLAQELLAKTDMPIGAVASHIGYANFSHFSRMFKKHTDLNPNEYRQIQQRESKQPRS